MIRRFHPAVCKCGGKLHFPLEYHSCFRCMEADNLKTEIANRTMTEDTPVETPPEDTAPPATTQVGQVAQVFSEEVDTTKSLPEWMRDIRAKAKELEKGLRTIQNHPYFDGPQAYEGQYGEMMAQAKLAVRHLEDARMRVGKVLQYEQGGVSVYDTV